VPVSIQDRVEAVRSGRVDIECSTTGWTLSRQAEADFTFVDGASIPTRTESDTGRLSDFGGKRIAVIPGTTTEKVLRESLALPRGDANFRLAVNRVLAGLYRTGGIQKIYEQWLGRIGPPSPLLSAAYYIQSLSEPGRRRVAGPGRNRLRAAGAAGSLRQRCGDTVKQ
jgi:ABC-type amino acid transport substrate-binding protein